MKVAGKTALVIGEQLHNYDLGPNHPLRPERIKIALALAKNYNLISSSYILTPRLAKSEELLLFHTEEYVNKVEDYSRAGYGILDAGDTPAFSGCFEITSWIVGASLVGIEAIIDGKADHAFNFSGGLHHAYPSKASGFCIFNDPAVCISVLKKKYGIKRIAYIDIDAHHGDGVMYGFYDDPSVLDVDFHEDGRYLFPGSGFPNEIGEGKAKGLKINIPLPRNVNDKLYLEAFHRIVPAALRSYEPEIILLQSGADSHKGDPLTHLSITNKTYNEIASWLHKFVHEMCCGKIMIFGGGGYLLSNVARCWVKVLSVFLEKEISAKIPDEWQKYYKSLTHDEAPNIMNEQEEEFLNQKAADEMCLILDELEETTCVSCNCSKN
jgi:acetoin utilization protein AcuC